LQRVNAIETAGIAVTTANVAGAPLFCRTIET